MARRWSAGEEQCPGEADCDRFKSAADPQGTYELQVLNACTACPMFPTKPKNATAEEEKADWIERLVGERNAGRPLFEFCSPLDWDLILVRDAEEEYHQRAAYIRQAQIVEMLLSRG